MGTLVEDKQLEQIHVTFNVTYSYITAGHNVLLPLLEVLAFGYINYF